MKKFKWQQGMTMVELLLVLGLFSIALVPAMMAMTGSFQLFEDTLQRASATDKVREVMLIIEQNIRISNAADIEVVPNPFNASLSALKVRGYLYYLQDTDLMEHYDAQERIILTKTTEFEVIDHFVTDPTNKTIEIKVTAFDKTIADSFSLSTLFYPRGR